LGGKYQQLNQWIFGANVTEKPRVQNKKASSLGTKRLQEFGL
jgi:hypothetical protein